MDHPTPAYVRPYLWPEALIETTRAGKGYKGGSGVKGIRSVNACLIKWGEGTVLQDGTLTQSEIPNEGRVHERSDETSRGGVDVDLDIESLFLF